MRKLTLKQEKFAILVGGGMELASAYREVYDVKPDTKPESTRNLACKLAALPHVAAKVASIKAPVVEKLKSMEKESAITLEGHLQKLAELRDAAESKDKYDAAVKAEIARGKAAGIVIEKREISGPNGGPLQSLNANITMSREELIAEAARRGLPVSIFKK